MNKDTTLGTNRTGMQASPMDSEEMLEILELQDEMPAPEIGADALRASYADGAGSVGSMPPPATVKGIVGTVGKRLSGHRMSVLLDKLGERAAFERAGVRLYDAALLKLAGVELPGDMTLDRAAEIRDEEAAHFAMLTEAIEQLGGDPTTQTPCADMAGVQGLGLVQAMGDPRATPAQILQTLLAAELVDGASWELLIELAGEFELADLQGRFSAALDAENRHLENVRRWLAAAVREDAAAG